MQHTFQKILLYKWLILFVLLLVTFFYWYEWHPRMIEKECNDRLVTGLIEGTFEQSDYDFFYKLCIRSGGVKNFREVIDK